jgi:hypothetical protein
LPKQPSEIKYVEENQTSTLQSLRPRQNGRTIRVLSHTMFSRISPFVLVVLSSILSLVSAQFNFDFNQFFGHQQHQQQQQQGRGVEWYKQHYDAGKPIS